MISTFNYFLAIIGIVISVPFIIWAISRLVTGAYFKSKTEFLEKVNLNKEDSDV